MALPGMEKISRCPYHVTQTTLQSAGESLGQGGMSQFWLKGRRVGAAQAPARTHNVPTLASWSIANTLKEPTKASIRKANQGRRPRGFPEKLPKNADFLWTRLPYGL